MSDRPERLELEAMTPGESLFTVYAPGGKYGFLGNGPIGWVIARIMPMMEADVYDTVAEMLDLQPDDELLDVGCGPGAFLATKGRDARRVVGLDPSSTMLRVAERKLAGRLQAGTALLVAGSAAALPFGNGEFSAVTAVFAPFDHAEVSRVLRPGGRFVVADNDPRRTASEPAIRWGRQRLTEAEHRQMLQDAGFVDPTVREVGAYLFVSCRRPSAKPSVGLIWSSAPLAYTPLPALSGLTTLQGLLDSSTPAPHPIHVSALRGGRSGAPHSVGSCAPCAEPKAWDVA